MGTGKVNDELDRVFGGEEGVSPIRFQEQPTWRQPMADEPGGRRNPSYETECELCGTAIRVTNNYSPQGDFLDQSTEPVGVAQERPPIDVLREVEDVIMSEPWWPRAGAIRRRAVMEKIRARLSRSVASPEPSE
jgi:hypothetical protein